MISNKRKISILDYITSFYSYIYIYIYTLLLGNVSYLLDTRYYVQYTYFFASFPSLHSYMKIILIIMLNTHFRQYIIIVRDSSTFIYTVTLTIYIHHYWHHPHFMYLSHDVIFDQTTIIFISFLASISLSSFRHFSFYY